MSVVVAMKDGDRILVGCDSQITSGYTKSTLRSQVKIWKPEDDKNIIMGHVGILRDANIVSTTEKWVDELTAVNNSVDFKYVVRNIVPKMFSELRDCGRLKYINSMQSMESEFIFTYKNNAYMIECNGCVREVEDFIAIGSGERLSLGAWNTIKKQDVSAEEKLIYTIKAACENDIYVDYPIVIMNTKDDEVKIINS